MKTARARKDGLLDRGEERITVYSVQCTVYGVQIGDGSTRRGEVIAGGPASQAFLRSKNLAARRRGLC